MPLGPIAIPPAVVGRIAESGLSLASSDVALQLRELLKLSRAGSILLSPLTIQNELRGALIVALDHGATSRQHTWLEALTSQLALALERMTLAENLHVRRSEERFRSLVRNASDIIVICDADGMIRYVSPSVERILGYSPDEFTGVSYLTYIHPEDRDAVDQAQTEILKSPGMTRALEYRVGHRNQTWHHVEAIKTNLLHDDSIRGLVINIRDITERKQAEELLTYQAFHDPLTDLPNRALFMDRLNHSLVRAQRRDESTGIIFLDIDRFKVVNDSLGHEAGDQLLKAAARRIKNGMRQGDTASRLGGDEFTILLEGIVDETDVVSVAERLRAEFEQPFLIDGREVFASASIGITVSRPGHGEAMDLLREADIAMYQAKGRDKGSFALFDADMGAAALHRLELETSLRRAIERGEFELYYQPTVDLATNRVVAMEGLLRWRQTDRGIVPPAEFIPMAEETGLIVPIGLWVLQEACRQAVLWREQFGDKTPTISVNLSARQLVHDSIVADVARTIAEAGVDPAMITLEITETFAVEDAETSQSTLEKLKAVGVRLAIDDFGSGYSSLGYLRQLPVDVLKIDRGFVQALGNTPGDTLIISSVSKIAHSRGMVVVAEGIEDAMLAERVRSLGCDLGQGFYWAKPLPAEFATAYLEGDFNKAAVLLAATA
jgi:diguanylate cyclase (GGDEF)-like protein/PAS domain S-box-containing protein